MTRSASEVRERVRQNGVSKRFIMKAHHNRSYGDKSSFVWDQRDRRFILDDELPSIDPDEKMTLK